MRSCSTTLRAGLLLLGAAIGYSNPSWGVTLVANRLPALPTVLTNNAVTSVPNSDGTYTLYSFMGMTDPTRPNTATVSSYRLQWPNGDWTPIADAPRLNNRGKVGASAVTVAGSVYLIGGYTTQFGEITESRLFRYDAASDSYEERASVPTEVDDTVAGVFQDRYIYLVSGWHGPINNNVLDVQVYDTVMDSWQSATDLPGPGSGLFGHSGTMIGNQLIAFDGTWVNNNSFVISDRVYTGALDPTDLTSIDWQELPAHPGEPTYRAAASQGPNSDGRMLLIGGTNNPYNFNGFGYNGQPSNPLNQALLFDPITNLWESVAISGDLLPTMDHRGLVRVGDGWATIGGMTGPGTATDQVVFYQLVPEPTFSACWWLGAILLMSRRSKAGNTRE